MPRHIPDWRHPQPRQAGWQIVGLHGQLGRRLAQPIKAVFDRGARVALASNTARSVP